MLCVSGEVEDERHFVLSCCIYKEMREKMFEVVKEVMLKKEKEEIEKILETDEGDSESSVLSWEMVGTSWKGRLCFAERRLRFAAKR